MDYLLLNIIILIIGVDLLVIMPIYFKKKNVKEAIQEEFDVYLRQLVKIDKQYAPHIQQLNKNLNTINYWLKTGKDPNESEEESENAEKEDRFFAGLMDPLEAKKWKQAVKDAKKKGEAIDEDIKSLRVPEFTAKGMEPMEVKQPSMKFYYATDFGEYIYYCVTPENLNKKYYKQVLYFTTSRPGNMPLVYPHKYDGAQMLSLYKHPAQTVWFLKNWKSIRKGLEKGKEKVVELDNSISEFDL